MKHHTKHGWFGTSLHRSWSGMKQRCSNPNHSYYYRYGGRGISYYADWADFLKFKEWAIKNGYRQDLTLDRIDNEGNYCPNNCQWITKSENSSKDKRGEACNLTKLTEHRVREIFNLGRNRTYSQQKIADLYGITRANVSAIVTGRSWKHLNLKENK